MFSGNIETNKISQLIEIMRQLRNPDGGCPWDLKQTYKTIIPYTIEEAYEVADAIEQGDFDDLKGELGDLLFQVIFYCQLAHEEGRFEFDDVVDTVCEKLIRRHPHVFDQANFDDEASVKANWEAEKAKERAAKANKTNAKTVSIFDNVPNNLPALIRAKKLQKRCVNIGFDWPNVTGALDKVKEEILELEDELNADSQDKEKIAEELGDLMFALVNVNRHLKLDPEMTLRAANQKFEKRFKLVEQLAVQQDKTLMNMTLTEMEKLWEQAKMKIKN